MKRSRRRSDDGLDRRSFLAAGLLGAAGATSGCIDLVESATGQGRETNLSLTIATVPTDSDRACVRIVEHLESNLEAVGVDVTRDVRSPSEFVERVLLDHDFDVFVGTHPAGLDPDFLYEALHSTYTHERGWQNPYGFTSMSFDALLEDQRRADGDERARLVGAILSALTEEKPFEPICVPDEYRVARTDRFDGWERGHLAARDGYLEVSPAEGVAELRALVSDARLTRTANPLSATLREEDRAVQLLYDSLATERDGELRPWLATDWEWTDGDDGPTATVDVREGCRFHDGEPVTAEDVAFTYRFLADTSIGRARVQTPAPRYRGRVSAIESVEVVDDHRLTISASTGREVAERAFEVPILPAHRWRALVEGKADSDFYASASGDGWSPVDIDNLPAVGSGPYRYESHSERDHLTLERYDEHFTLDEDVDRPAPSVETIRFEVDPGSATSVQRVLDDGADVTASRLASRTIDEVAENRDVDRFRSPPQRFYQLGFNVRSSPCSNTHLRRAVTHLLDKAWIAEEVFHGHATPVATPLDEAWVPEELSWDGADPVTPFPGEDGELDVEAAKSLFEAAGYRYDDEGRLLRGY